MNIVKKRKGFTLVELLVIVGMIILLASILIVSIKGARQRHEAEQQQSQSHPVTSDQPADMRSPIDIPNATVITDNVLKFPSVYKDGRKVFDGCLRRWQEKHPDMEVVSMSSQPGDGEWAIYTYVTIRRKQ